MSRPLIAVMLSWLALAVGCSRPDEQAAEPPVAQPAESEAEPAPVPEETRIEPQARQLVRAMCDVVAGAQSFRIHTSETHDRVLPTGEKTQRSYKRELVLQRPDGLYAHYMGGEGREADVWYDGELLTVQGRGKKMYAQAKVPPTIDQTLDFVDANMDIKMPMADLFYTDPCEAYVGQETTGRYVGLEEIDGVKAHHLAFQDVAVDFDLWIQDGPQALPKKLELTYKLDEGQPKSSIVFDRWELEPTLAADQFDFKLVDGAVRIRFEGQKREEAGPTEAKAS